MSHFYCIFFFFKAEDGIRVLTVTGVQTCALPISNFEPPLFKVGYAFDQAMHNPKPQGATPQLRGEPWALELHDHARDRTQIHISGIPTYQPCEICIAFVGRSCFNGLFERGSFAAWLLWDRRGLFNGVHSAHFAHSAHLCPANIDSAIRGE